MFDRKVNVRGRRTLTYLCTKISHVSEPAKVEDTEQMEQVTDFSENPTELVFSLLIFGLLKGNPRV